MNDPRGIESSFFQAGGILKPDSPSYIEREADEELFRLVRAGEYCNVLAARQTGKSSLIVRTQQQLRREGVRTALVDLTAIGSQEFTAEEWFFSLISEISSMLELKTDQYDWWQKRSPLTPVQRFTEFLQRVVLGEIDGPIVIFIDDIDSTLALSLADDFFIAIRAMYNERASNVANRRLAFVLVGVARAVDLIKDRSRTPYNIGSTVDLADFSRQNAQVLLKGLDRVHPGRSAEILERVLYWTSGHPYLTQRMCAAIAARQGETWTYVGIDELASQLFIQEGQIRNETNLQWIDDYIGGSPHREEMLQVHRDILSGKQVPDRERSEAKNQLKLSGLVKPTPAGYLKVRNRIYERVFGLEWAGATPPPALRLKVVVWLGIVLFMALAATTFALVASGVWPPRTFTPTLVPTSTQTPTNTYTLEPTDTHTPGPTNTYTPKPTDTHTPGPTNTYTPKPTDTFTPKPTDTSVPVLTSTTAPTPEDTPTLLPTDTPTPTHTPVPIRLQEEICTAPTGATIYDRPGVPVELKELGTIFSNEQVELIGYPVAPWTSWAYIRYREQIEGFVWKELLDCQTEAEWPTLEIIQAFSASFCGPNQTKMAALRVQVLGGDGNYTFMWGDQQVDARSEEISGYLLSWLWGSAPRGDALTVRSGDGQTAITESIWITEPTCN
jgi:hypothetical protein